jgi:hypothetical protein
MGISVCVGKLEIEMIELMQLWEHCCQNLRGEFEMEYIASVVYEPVIKFSNGCKLQMGAGNGCWIAFYGPDRFAGVDIKITREEYDSLLEMHKQAEDRLHELRVKESAEIARKLLIELLDEFDINVVIKK